MKANASSRREWLLTRCHNDHRIQPFAGSSAAIIIPYCPTWAKRRFGQKSVAPPSRNSTGGFVIANRLVTQESPASVSIGYGDQPCSAFDLTFRAAAHQPLDHLAAGDGAQKFRIAVHRPGASIRWSAKRSGNGGTRSGGGNGCIAFYDSCDPTYMAPVVP